MSICKVDPLYVHLVVHLKIVKHLFLVKLKIMHFVFLSIKFHKIFLSPLDCLSVFISPSLYCTSAQGEFIKTDLLAISSLEGTKVLAERFLLAALLDFLVLYRELTRAEITRFLGTLNMILSDFFLDLVATTKSLIIIIIMY